MQCNRNLVSSSEIATTKQRRNTMPTTNVKRSAVITAIVMLIGILAWTPASAQTWTNTNPEGGSWFDENNWSTSAIPTDSTNAVIANGGTAIIDTGAADVGQFRVGNSAGDVGHLIINNDLRTYTHATYFANDGGTASIVQNSGDFVAGWVNDTTFRDAFFGSAAGTFDYTMHGGSFEVKRHTYLQGENSLWTVNNGTVSLNSDFVMGLGSQFVLNGGTATVNALYLNDTSTIHVNGGNFTSGSGNFVLGRNAGSNVAFYQSGGTVNTTAAPMNFGNWETGATNQSVLYEISGGSMTATSLRVRTETNHAHFRVVGSNIAGINITTFSDWHLATTSVREFILDNGSSHITTIQASGSQPLTGELRAGLRGGVMLSGVNSFHLLEAASFSGGWTATPSALWTTDIANNINGTRDAVRIALDSEYNQGTLDVALAKNRLDLSELKIGYVNLSNVGSTLEIGLDFGDAGVDFVHDDLNLFKAGLTAAGIDWTTGYGVYEVGLFLDPSISGGSYFAWNLSDYGTLELHGIANVIPEPSGLMLLGLAGLALLRRRRRR